MKTNKRQMKIKNRPDYLFNDGMIADIGDFDPQPIRNKPIIILGCF